MRPSGFALLVTLLFAAVTPARQSVPAQTDSITQVLNAIQGALASNDVEAFRALGAPSLPKVDTLAFELTLFGGGGVTNAAVRERDRETAGGVTKSLVEILVDRGGDG